MAGNAFSQGLRIVVGKLETAAAEGTPVSPASADFDVAIKNPEVAIAIPPDDESAKFSTGDHGEAPAIMGAQSGSINFNIQMCMGASVSVAPKWWKFAQACGAVVKAYSTTGIALQPLKEGDNKTMTISVYDIQQGSTPAAIMYKYAGCMGTMQFGADGIGKPWVAKFSMTGKLVSVTDVANGDIPVLTSPDTALAEKLLSNVATFGGTASCLSTFNMDTGNTINPYICQSEATGYKYFAITERKPRFSYNPLLNVLLGNDIIAEVLASTSNAVSIQSTNMKLAIPVTQMMAPAIAAREGYVNWNHTMRCLRNGSMDAGIAAEGTWELLIGARA